MTPPQITDQASFRGDRVALRRLRMEDCSVQYVGWLQDPEVNRYLETRWSSQTLETVRAFVAGVRARTDTWLFAILDEPDGWHVGNIKLGPVDPHHACADVSYFIGERTMWGRGLATDAIRVAVGIAFEYVGLHRVQAGVYASNTASARALARVGFVQEARLRQRLRSGSEWEDHLLYGLLRAEWAGSRQAP